MVFAFIGVGSNLGDRLKNIKQSIKFLSEAEGIEVVGVSSFSETEPQEALGPNYLNGVIKIQTILSAEELLKRLQDIESRLQRVRSFKNAPRTIDLDILLYGKEVINTPDLIIPHPSMFRRDFVIGPLFEIEPDIEDLLKSLNVSLNIMGSEFKDNN